MLRLATLCVVVGCGAQAASPTAPNATPAVASDRFAMSPPLVTPGERMSYKLQLGGVDLAVYDFAIGELTTVGNKKAIVVQSHAKAVGLVQMVAKVDDFFTSWIDVENGRPLRWTTDEFATKGADKERTDARFFERAGDSVPIDYHVNDDAPKAEPQKVSMQDVWDYNAFLVALRTWDAPPGSTITAEVMRSRYMWHVEMKVKGKTKLATELGDMPAIELEGHTWKVDRNDVRIPDSDARDFSVWISDDDARVPLKNVAKTDYGDIQMLITDYQQGNGTRLRN